MCRSLGLTIGIIVILFFGSASAQSCPPDCPIKGGGSRSTDCLLEFDGVTPVRPGSRLAFCTDGDPACDHDGTINGVCAYEVKACLNNADPSLPSCSVSGQVEDVRFRGAGLQGRKLETAIRNLLPAQENVCTVPVTLNIPIFVRDLGELGDRHFEIDFDSSPFTLTGQPFGNFVGSIDFHAGAPDPVTGVAFVDVTATSDFIYADLDPFGVLCIKVVAPTPKAGLISCGRRGGQLFRARARADRTFDHDTFALVCRPNVMFNTGLTLNHNVGTVGVNGFTQEDCDAAGGMVEQEPPPNAIPRPPYHPNVCNGTFEISQVEGLETEPGAMLLAPLADLEGPLQLPIVGLPVEISLQSDLPCVGEGIGISTAIPVTTGLSRARIDNVNNVRDAFVETELHGDNFSCVDFSTPGKGTLVLSAPQLDLPFVKDAIAGFTFAELPEQP